MKKLLLGLTVFMTLCFCVTGCTETEATDENGNAKKEFSVGETAIVGDSKIKINSVSKIKKECSWEYNGKCQSYNEPDNDFFLLIDLTIENTGSEEQTVSSILDFDLKTPDGEQAESEIFLEAIKSQLDGTVMAGDLLKGQIAFDVKSSDSYYFYYENDIFSDPIKFVISSSDIK